MDRESARPDVRAATAAGAERHILLAEWRARKASDDAMVNTRDNAVSLPSSDAAEKRR
jgi:hypothetical protein